MMIMSMDLPWNLRYRGDLIAKCIYTSLIRHFRSAADGLPSTCKVSTVTKDDMTPNYDWEMIPFPELHIHLLINRGAERYVSPTCRDTNIIATVGTTQLANPGRVASTVKMGHRRRSNQTMLKKKSVHKLSRQVFALGCTIPYGCRDN